MKPQPPANMHKSSRFLSIVLVASVALLAASCSPAEASPETPEGAVFTYLRHLERGEVEAAWDLLSERARSNCQFSEFQEQAVFAQETLSDSRVIFKEVRRVEDTAIVVLTIDAGGGLPPFSNGGRYDQQYRVVPASDEWRLDETGWPLYVWCPPPSDRLELTPSPATPAASPEAI